MAYNAIMLSISAILLQFLGFFYRVVLSRVGLADGMGMYSLVMPIYSVMSAFCISGITMALSKTIPAINIKQKLKNVSRTIRYSIGIFFTLFSITAFLVILFNKVIATSFLGEERARFALLLILPCLFLTGLENMLKAFFHGIKNVYAPITSETTEQIVRIISVMVLTLILKPTSPEYFCAVVIMGMIVSECFSIIILGVFYKIWIVKKTKVYDKENKDVINKLPQDKIFKGLLCIILPVAFGSAVNSFLYSIGTMIIPSRLEFFGFDPVSAISKFGIIVGMTMPLLMLPSCFISPLLTVIMPRIAGSYAKKDYSDIKRKTNKLIRLTALFVFPMSLFIVVFGKNIAVLLFNQPTAGDNLFIFSLSAVFTFFYMIFSCVLNGVGRQKRVIINCIVTAIFELFITYFGVGYFGLEGFIYGHLISSIISMIDLYLVLRKEINLKIPVFIHIINPLLCSVLAVLVTLIFSFYLTINLSSIAALILNFSFFICIYSFLLRYVGLNPTKAIKNAYYM